LAAGNSLQMLGRAIESHGVYNVSTMYIPARAEQTQTFETFFTLETLANITS